MTIKKLTKDTLIYEEGQENSLDIINNNFEELKNHKVPLEKTDNETNAIIDSSRASVIRFRDNWKDTFTNAVVEKNFIISRFVNGNWVNDPLIINNTDWRIWIDGVNNSANSLQIMWTWMNVTKADSSMKIEIRDNRILPWCDWYNAEFWWGAFTGNNEIYWIGVGDWLGIMIRSQKIIFAAIPTSPAGLTSWCVWRDGENLKIIP